MSPYLSQHYALQGKGILFLISIILGLVLLIPVMFVLDTHCSLLYFSEKVLEKT